MLSLLEQEIYSQADVLARFLERETEHVARIVAQLPAFEYVMIAARGSSDHAALYAKYAWATFASYPIALAAPSLNRRSTTCRWNNALWLGVATTTRRLLSLHSS